MLRFSIVVPVHNEGAHLEGTLSLLLASEPPPYEIVVVDDYSTTGPLSTRLAWTEERAREVGVRMRILLPPEQQGPGGAKRFGGMAATGDVIILLDAHMRMPTDWLTIIDHALGLFPDAIMCTCCRGFQMTAPFFGAGARFLRSFGPTDPHGVPQRQLILPQMWLKRGPLEAIDTVPSVLGACYIIPRHIWTDLKGLNPNLHGWGCEEHDLSIRAWMYGYEVRRINGLTVLHRFGSPVPGNRMNVWQPAFNLWVTAATLFEDGVFDEIYRPGLQALGRERAEARFAAEYQDIMAFRDEVQARRVYDDDELLRLIEYRHPTRPEIDGTLERVRRAQHHRPPAKRQPRDHSMGLRPLPLGRLLQRDPAAAPDAS